MRILRLSLRPFAGFRERDLSFAPGLNVVLGANDKGKTTVFRAIDCAFFLPSRVSRSTKEGREILPRILPLGGDHARLSLDFEAQGRAHRLEKCWGQSSSVALESEGGACLTGEERVEESLRGLLPAPAATFQSVLLMGQGALEGTVASLERDREALHSLGDLLRLSADQGGVSVERLKDRLARKIELVFSHWDRQANLPEKGKGLEDEWKKNVGSVLEAYYARERLRRESRLALELETERDRRLAELNARQALQEEARAFVRANEKFVASASERQALEGRIAAGRAEGETMEKDLHAWIRAESDRGLCEPEVRRLEAARAAVDEELRLALARLKRRDLLLRHRKAAEAHTQLAEARARLGALPVVTSEQLGRLRAAFLEVERLRGALKAGKLMLSFQVKQDLDVSVRKDLEPERKGRMVPGKPMTVHAGGRIQLSSDLFELQVTAGDSGAADLDAALARALDSLGKLCMELRVETLAEAEEARERYAEAARLVKSAETLLQSALAPGEKLEELERQARAWGGGAAEEPAREPELVQAERQSLLRELEAKREALVRSESQRKGLEARYGVESSSVLTKRLLERGTELAGLEKKLAALPSLPEDLSADFLPRFRRAQLEAGTMGDELRALAVEIEQLKARLPEQSAQELERASREADAAFQRELAHGQALLRVALAVRVVESQGGDRFAGFRAEFEGLVARLSAGRYPQAALTEALPTRFRREDGAEVPYPWLSAGTKDAFALALRLAMAGHFLGEADGFLLIDDPLVNMDPGRQEVAAALLRDFAARRQVVVFTCHPAHAELLGGQRLLLE